MRQFFSQNLLVSVKKKYFLFVDSILAYFCLSNIFTQRDMKNMPSKEKIGIITLGCSKNTVDSERLASQLNHNNFTLVEDPNEADTIIINTCGFIEDAKEESINTILEAIELKKMGEIKKVIVTGCLSQRYEVELQKELPEVDSFHGTEDYEGILREIGGDLKKELLGERALYTPNHFSYLKISEGCNNPCSFCAIPLIRGKHVSKTIEELYDEAKFLATKGVRELNIIGQDTTYYGKDIYKKRALAELLNKISTINNIEWIRLLYSYPYQFPEEVITEIANNQKICKYIDIPLQHISDNVLKSMRRKITSLQTRELVEKFKTRIPNITLRTTFIVGYPSETEKDFEELYNFVKETKFDRVGVFTYSPEEDTYAYDLGNPIHAKEKERRKQAIMELQKDISFENNSKYLDTIQKVLIDRVENEFYIGRTERDAPEVDGEVIITAPKNNLEIGKFYDLKINDCTEYDLFAKLS